MLTKLEREAILREMSMDRDTRRMTRDFYNKRSTWHRLHAAIQPPDLHFGFDREARLKAILDTLPASGYSLEIGSGTRRLDDRVINMDIDLFTNVDVVGLGEKLPFLDKTFDFVSCRSVLEHLRHPNRTVSEMFRILKPGGWVYGDSTFMAPYHGYPAHYQNYTASGLSELFCDFEVVEIGVLRGPSHALRTMIKSYMGVFVADHDWLRIPINLVTAWVTFPLGFMDMYLNRKQEALRVAADVFLLGRKPTR